MAARRCFEHTVAACVTVAARVPGCPSPATRGAVLQCRRWLHGSATTRRRARRLRLPSSFSQFLGDSDDDGERRGGSTTERIEALLQGGDYAYGAEEMRHAEDRGPTGRRSSSSSSSSRGSSRKVARAHEGDDPAADDGAQGDDSRSSSGQRRGLRSARVAMRRKFGQHLLKNVDVVKAIVASADIGPEDHVLEIGPGTGNMTTHMLQQAKHVTAIELDERLYNIVQKRVATMGLSHKFTCIHGDFMKTPLPDFDLCVSNIPFQISSPVVNTLLSHRPLMKRAVIMFQSEFADRLVARPGEKDYSRLSVHVGLLAKCKQLRFIPRAQFRPPPKVDCAVAEIVPLQPPTDIDLEAWQALLRICFQAKNKTLRAVFRLKSVTRALNRGRVSNQDQPLQEVLDQVLQETELVQYRANGMDVEQFKRLYHALQAAGIDLGLVAITTAVAAGGRTGKASQRSPLAGVLTPLAEATMIAADERSTPT